MKKLILIVMPIAMLMGQHKRPAVKPAAPAQAPPAAKQEPLKVPEGAKELEPYMYGYTDPQGKKWIYRQTPFGVVRWEDKPVMTRPIDDSNPVEITDLGDSVRFQWKTPFGNQKQVRKKSELTEDEKAMIQREQNKPAAVAPKAVNNPPDSTRKIPEKQ